MSENPETDGLLTVQERTPIAPYIAGVVAVILAALLWVFATSDTSTDRTAASPLIGELRPDVSALALDGETFDLAAWDGDWVVVNFFATWCTPCRVEHPELVKFAERHQGGDAHLVSIAFEDSEEDVRKFFEEEGGEWPVIIERGAAGSIGLEYGVTGLPESFIVCPNGLVASRLIGGFSADQVDALIARQGACAS